LIPRKKTIKAMLPIVAAPKYRGEAEADAPGNLAEKSGTMSRDTLRALTPGNTFAVHIDF
jgi:hypothetical protein